jgi:predicted acetyltransferase
MTQPTIRRLEGEEMLDAVYPLTTYALHPSPPLPDVDQWKAMVRPRRGLTCYVAFEGDVPAACAVSTAMTQNVRGALLGMGGIWGVATRPDARRKGYCRALIGRLLAAMRDAGRPLSALYPFRESFYERLGYVTLPQVHRVVFHPATLAPLLEADMGGEIELALSGEGFDAYCAYVAEMQRYTHGVATFDEPDRARAARNYTWVARAVVGGETVALMVYRLIGERETEFNFVAHTFHARTSQGRYLLLAWIARHVDQANRVELWLPRTALPETWLADLDVQVERAYFTPMGRVADVAGIEGLETGPGAVTVALRDPLCPWNEGVWRLETVAGRLAIRPGEEADCWLSIQGLSALIYGAHDPGDLALRGWGDPAPETLATLARMFPRRLAYLHEVF